MNRKHIGTFKLVATILLAAGLSAAHAVTNVVQPVAAVALVNGDTFNAEFPGRGATNTFNSSGISSPGSIETGDSMPLAWPTHTNLGNDGWHTQASPAGSPPNDIQITWDLGDTYKLVGLHLWNFNAPANYRSLSNVVVTFSTTSATSGFGGAQSFIFAQAPNSASYEGETHFFAGLPEARWVRFNVLSTYGLGNDGGTGLSEIRFLEIPEPGVATLLGIGWLLVWRRRG